MWKGVVLERWYFYQGVEPVPLFWILNPYIRCYVMIIELLSLKNLDMGIVILLMKTEIYRLYYLKRD